MLDTRPLTRVAQHLLNTPLLTTDHHALVIASAIRDRLNIKLLMDGEGLTLRDLDMNMLQLEAQRDVMSRNQRRAASSMAAKIKVKPNKVRRGNDAAPKIFQYQDGIAIIQVTGTLTKNWGLDPMSGMTGYDGIKMKLIAAYDDPDVNAILLLVDSPGGVVAGCFDLADLIFAVNAEKPIWTIADEQMCSAAFALGSQGTKVFGTRTSDVGSVGVLWLYTNVQGAYEQEGIQVRLFKAGADKAEGNPYEPLSDDAAGRIQKTLDDMRAIFIDTVARGMKLSKAAVRNTNARSFTGTDAQDIGFVSEIASVDQVWNQMVAKFGH